MKATRKKSCIPFEGREKAYQAEASGRFFVETGIVPTHYAWVTTTCGTSCLNVEHIRFNEPVRLKYPKHVCIYCGRSGYTEDHLLPRRWTGESARKFVAVVPACGTCNNVLGDTLTSSITERRAICHARLRKRYSKVLKTVEYGPSDLAEFGPNLRAFIVSSMEKRATVMQMLRFPDDISFDMRALQKSGIEDPYGVGLLISDEEAVRIAREVCGRAAS